MWVIESPADLAPGARRRVPQVIPDREAQFRRRRIGYETDWPGERPPIHNAWVIRGVEDV
jgi:hypothetical protein